MSNSIQNDQIETLLSFSELLLAVHGSLISSGVSLEHCSFSSVTTDSRSVVQGSLFVPLIGEKQDGHRYIPDALDKGASVVFVAQSAYSENEPLYQRLQNSNKHTGFIVVEHTLYALQNAAEAYVKKFPHLIRVSITGSSGKTTTKEIAASIFSQKYKVITNKGNLNSETGLPLSVFSIRSEHELGLFEMGMNRTNEIGELATVFKPQYAAITNIGTAHIGILGSRKAIAEEKKKIFSTMTSAGVAVIPAEDDFSDFLAAGVNGKIVFYGQHVTDSGVTFISNDGLNGSTFSVDGVSVHLRLPGIYNYFNALAAIALAKNLGMSTEQIRDGIESIEPIFGRSQILHGSYDVLQDCYNANPDSMERAIELCDSVTCCGKKIFILGDMLELGSESRSAHEHVGYTIVDSNADLVIFIGVEMKAAYEAAVCRNNGQRLQLMYIQGSDEAAIKKAAETVNGFILPGSLVLLKASRGMSLERITALLHLSEFKGELHG